MASIEKGGNEVDSSLAEEVDEILEHENKGRQEADVWHANTFRKEKFYEVNQNDDVWFLHTRLFDGELGERATRNDDGSLDLPYAPAREIYSEVIGSKIENKELDIIEEDIPDVAETIVEKYKETIEDSDFIESSGLDIEVDDDFYDDFEYFQTERLKKRLDEGFDTAYDLPLR